MNTEKLKATIDFLRENGVAHYHGEILDENNVVELLLIDKPQKLESAAKPGPLAKVPRGKDGLSAQEQEDLYGSVIDAEPEK